MQTNSVIRWAGSKRSLASTLIPMFPAKYRRYVEPFCGSASLYFRQKPCNALLADTNEELIHALRRLRLNPKAFFSILENLPVDEDAYYSIRASEPEALNADERAARFYYLNHLCFNGIYRTNELGKFNVPFAKDKVNLSLTWEQFAAASKALSNVSLSCSDFRGTLNRVKPDDFIYLDPPYATNDQAIFRSYGKRIFSVDDLVDLIKLLKKLDSQKIRFMLSYTECEEVRKIPKHWRLDQIQVRRNVAGFTGSRKIANEVVIRNY